MFWNFLTDGIFILNEKLPFLTCDTLLCNIKMIEHKTFTIEFIYNVLFPDIFELLCKMHLFLNFIVIGVYRKGYLKLGFIHYIFIVSTFTVMLTYDILDFVYNSNSRFNSRAVKVSWLVCSIWIFFVHIEHLGALCTILTTPELLSWTYILIQVEESVLFKLNITEHFQSF